LLRAELDGLAARLAVARASARDWERAQQAVEELRKVPADDEDALAGAHARVHSAIYALGFGPRMTLFVENHVLGYIELALSVGAGRTTAESSYRAHTALLRALASGDAGHAEEVAREHARKGSKVAVRAAGAGTVSAAPGKGPAKART
jgi:DNA-binding GntR family transcriptional regulator